MVQIFTHQVENVCPAFQRDNLEYSEVSHEDIVKGNDSSVWTFIPLHTLASVRTNMASGCIAIVMVTRILAHKYAPSISYGNEVIRPHPQSRVCESRQYICTYGNNNPCSTIVV